MKKHRTEIVKFTKLIPGGQALGQLDSGKKVFAWALKEDEVAVQALDKMIERLAAGIANVCYIVNPEMIILGGGIMAQTKYIGPRLDAELEKALLPIIYKGTKGVFAKLAMMPVWSALYIILCRHINNLTFKAKVKTTCY